MPHPTQRNRFISQASPSARRWAPLLMAMACAAGTAMAQGQTAPSSGATTNRSSVLPYTQDGYAGISAGRTNYDLRTGGLPYDDSGTGFKIYTGGFFHPNLGVEFGYLNAGKARRLGGDTEAHGFNLSLVGRAPLTEQFDVFGKVGTTY